MNKTLRFVVSHSIFSTKYLLLTYLLFQTVIAFGSIVNSYIFKIIIDNTSVDFSLSKLQFFILVFIAFQILLKIMDGVTKYVWSLIHSKQILYYNRILIDKIATLNIGKFENSFTVGLINRVYARIGQSPFYLRGIVDLYASFVTFIATVAIFIFSQPITAIIIVFTNIVPLFIRSKLAKSSFRLYMADDETKRKFGYTAELITDRDSLMEVKIAQAFNYVKNRFLNLFVDFTNRQLAIEQKYQILTTLSEFLPILGISLFILQITSQLGNSTITIGTFVFLFTNTITFSASLRTLSQNFDFLQQDALPLSEMEDFFAMKPDIIFPQFSKNNRLLRDQLVSPHIEFKNISFKYPNSKEFVFRNLSLDIPFGQKVAIIGENGAGKSTLIKLLMRIYDVQDGSILINNINIKDIPEEYLYQLFSTLFQDYAKFHLTVRENFELIRGHEISDSEIAKLLDFSSLSSFIGGTTMKFNQQLGPEFTDGIDMSGGQWQRLAISRAFAKKSPVLILDEPTSAVDAKNESEIFEKINSTLHKSTLIYISHRFSTIKDAERIVVIDKGEIIEDGNHYDLMKNRSKYFELYSLQAKRFKK